MTICWDFGYGQSLVFERLKVGGLVGKAFLLKKLVGFRCAVVFQLLGKPLEFEHGGMRAPQERYQVRRVKEVGPIVEMLHLRLSPCEGRLLVALMLTVSL